ncbi:MAG: serine hydrolase [Bacteroidia bacterium]|nr:serine hydrolase [Bacteroidia bacterium]
MKAQHVFPAIVLVLMLQGCLSVDPFIEIDQNPYGTDIESIDLLSEASKTEITRFIEDNTRFDACIVMQGNKLVYSYGSIHVPYNAASVRKSIFSALFGIASDQGLIDLDATLAELGVDDSINPLTPTEKTATVRHLLTARSGIYLPSIGESAGMKRRKPSRGAYAPNEHFYYNNWDFNVLPIILERVTDKKLGDIIYEWLAIPLGMKDFVPSNVTYEYAGYTEHPQTRVYISAEDLARFSSVYLTGGAWNNSQVIPADWVVESTQKVSSEPEEADLVEHPFMEGYAYLWWIDEDEQTFWADGAGGHFCIVDRQRNLAVILRNNTGMSSSSLLLYNADNPYEDNESGNDVYNFIKSKL